MPTAPIKRMRCRQRRKRKLHYLHRRLAEAKSKDERRRLIAKIRKTSRTSPVPDA